MNRNEFFKILTVAYILLSQEMAKASVIEAPFPTPLALPTRDIDPESYDLALRSKPCKEKNCQWWADYMRAGLFAQSQKDISCKLYVTLSEQEDFALRPLAFIRASKVCNAERGTQEKLLNGIDDFIKKEKSARWLKTALLEAQTTIASQVSDEAFVTRAVEAATAEKTKKAKVDLLTQAILRAKNLSKDRMTAIENELAKISKTFKKTSSTSDWLAIANEAFLNHDYEAAEKGYKRVIKMAVYTPLMRRTALDLLRQTYKIGQKKKQAFLTTKKLWAGDAAAFKADPSAENLKYYVSTGLLLARTHWTEHRNKEARRVLNKLLRTKGALTSDVNFILARIDEEEGKDEKALIEMEEAIKLSAKDQGIPKAQYQWPYAWLSFKQKKYEQAANTLISLSQTETDAGKKAQQLFWLAQTYKNLGKPGQARPLLEKIISDDPLSYYTMLAYRDLNQPIPKVDKPQNNNLNNPESRPSLSKLSKLVDVDWNLFRWLVAANEPGYARQFLVEEVPVPDPSSMKDWKFIFNEYASIRFLSPLFGKLNKLSSSEKLKILAEHREFLFPTPFIETVNDAARSSGLWPEFIFSIMRQESSFDPNSISPANAYGLLQLLPGVARQVGRAHKIKFKTNADLLDPTINIPLGAFHLRSYWNEFGGQFLLTTAAYNASPETVKNWVSTRYRGDVLQFIEDIPFEETRTYVKLVLRNFINYLRINSSAASIPFPEWCLQGLQASNQ